MKKTEQIATIKRVIEEARDHAMWIEKNEKTDAYIRGLNFALSVIRDNS